MATASQSVGIVESLENRSGDHTLSQQQCRDLADPSKKQIIPFGSSHTKRATMAIKISLDMVSLSLNLSQSDQGKLIFFS